MEVTVALAVSVKSLAFGKTVGCKDPTRFVRMTAWPSDLCWI